jgi:Rieske 2Fe-2S family protein
MRPETREGERRMASIIDHPTFTTNLPREYYLSEEIFQTELRKVFCRQWLYAGRTSQVKEPGDFYVRDVGPESLIIARDQEGNVRAYFNVCRHRGSRICTSDASGTAKRFTCPYHQWTYGINGALRAAPGANDGQDFDYADFGLHEAHVDSYFGSIYVFLGEDEPQASLFDTLSAVTRDLNKLAAVQPERTKLAARRVYDVNCNWKTLNENNHECYHCPGGHAALCVSWDPWAGVRREDGMTRPWAEGQQVPLRETAKTFSIDGDWVCDKFLGTPQGERFSTGHISGPIFNALAYLADHGVAIIVEPVTRDRSRLVAEWIVHEDAVEGIDYDVERLIKVFDITNLEDIVFAEQNHAGITSMRFTPGPMAMGGREEFVAAGIRHYLEMMEA